MRRAALLGASALILLGVLGVFNALGFIQVSIGSLFWALVLIAAGVWLLWGVVGGRPSVQSEKVTISLEGASSARVRIRHGAGRLEIKAGAAANELAGGMFGGGLDYDVRQEGEVLDVEMRVASQGFPGLMSPWGWVGARGLDWSVGLSGEIPLSLEIQGGASDNRLDLSDLSVTDFRLQTGASSTNLTLPAGAGHTKAEVRSGVGSVSIRIPMRVAARIRVKGALSGTTVDRSRFPRKGRAYESADYATAANKVDLDVQMSVGSVDIR